MNKKKINILMIVPSLRLGGAERQAVDLANAISSDRFNVHLITFEKDTDLLGDLNRKKVMFSRLVRKHKFDLSFTKEIARIIRDGDIDIVHGTLQIAFLFGFLGRWRSGRKPRLVCSLHTTVNRSLKDEIFDWLLFAPLLTFCAGIITVCRNQKRYWSRKFPWLSRKMITVHNGVDLERYRDPLGSEGKGELRASMGIEEEDFVAVMVAGFRPEKGHVFALRAIERLVREGRKIKLILIGDGERRQELEALSRSLGLGETVLWMGCRKDPRPYLSISDVLLLSSFAVETFPLSVLEALSMGKPVIATSVGGIPEVLREGINGILVKPRDIEALHGALVRMMSDGNFRRKLAENARESVKKDFTIAEMASKTEEALMGWLPPGRRPGRAH
jgi:glycosyltransferase involved in cell wall biosynthesis